MAFRLLSINSPNFSRFAVQPFRGCIRNLKLDSEYVSLARPRATKGVQSSCVNREVRIGTLLSERSFAQFTGLNLDGQLALSFRFRPADYGTKGETHLVSVMVNNDQEELLRVNIEDGTSLVIRPNGDDAGMIRAPLSQHLAGGWHHLSVLRDAQTLRAFVDDVLEEERSAPIEGVELLVSFVRGIWEIHKIFGQIMKIWLRGMITIEFFLNPHHNCNQPMPGLPSPGILCAFLFCLL